MSETRSQLTAGDRFGKYMVLGLIGRGKLTEVYRAYDPELKRNVALKTFSHEAAPVQAFAQETQAIIALRHPNVMRVYESGTDANLHFIVMELIEGSNLRDVLSASRTGMDREAALRIFTQLADAVASAHDQGLIHGNIKPDNVLMDRGERPVLTDFYIPSLQAAASQTRLAAYLAPEQATATLPTAQADIYALGILLYEMITGDVPFKGDYASTMALHQTAVPARPSQIRVDLDPRTENVILKALGKTPVERFASARELVKALESSEATNQYQTVNLNRKNMPELSKRRSDIRRFELSRVLDTPQKPASPQREPSLALWIAALVLLAIVIVLLAAILW